MSLHVLEGPLIIKRVPTESIIVIHVESLVALNAGLNFEMFIVDLI